MTDPNGNEHYVRRGDPHKPTYYIIRRHSSSEGLFYRFMLIAGHIKYALAHGWIPVVDMQNYPNPYLPPDKLGKENSWEYYFEQPFKIGLAEAYGGENVILSSTGGPKDRPFWSMSFLSDKNRILTRWQALVELGLIRVKSARLAEIAALREKLFKPGERILGVLLRGTDYLTLRPQNHPIPPPTEFAVSVVLEKLREWRCNRIFLATEDKSIVKIFKTVFDNKLIPFEREYTDFNPDKKIGLQHIERENDHFLQGRDYLAQMVLLSTCKSFVAARCSGAVGVMMMTRRFEHTYFFNLGRYGVISLD